MKFEQQILGEFFIDHEYESYVKGWMAYHEAANEVDGHIPAGHPEQRKLTRIAVSSGWNAMKSVLGFAGHNPFIGINIEAAEKWQNAKLEALRRLGL